MSHATSPAHDPVVDALVLDLLSWIGAEGRPYAEVMEAWRTSRSGALFSIALAATRAPA